MESFSFWFFGACTLIGALLVAFGPRLVHSAFALVLALIGVAGLYWGLGADFLGGVQLLVYVGGITILFIYGIMLTPKGTTKWSASTLLFPGLIAVVPVGVMLHLAWTGLASVLPAASTAEPVATADTIGRAFLTRDQYLVPFELASLVLLSALVGSVYLARRKKES